jgi:hypothetical protein
MLEGAVAPKKCRRRRWHPENPGLQPDHLSPEMLKLTRQLFDVLGMAVTRGPLTGIWGSWENASGDEIRHSIAGRTAP